LFRDELVARRDLFVFRVRDPIIAIIGFEVCRCPRDDAPLMGVDNHGVAWHKAERQPVLPWPPVSQEPLPRLWHCPPSGWFSPSRFSPIQLGDCQLRSHNTPAPISRSTHLRPDSHTLGMASVVGVWLLGSSSRLGMAQSSHCAHLWPDHAARYHEIHPMRKTSPNRPDETKDFSHAHHVI